MKPLVPNSRVSLLSAPSKMPGYSFGLPAHKACPRANGTICDGCYASKGFYAFSGPRNAQNVRFDWTRECMKTAAGRAEFVQTMIAAVKWSTRKQEYFRVHDSGDFFSPAYAQAWLEIMRALPEVKFWAPTRVWQRPAAGSFVVIGSNDGVLTAVRAMAELENVTIRPSALNFGDEAPMVNGLHAGSTADGIGQQCPAPKQGNACGDCRACWDDKNQAISYKKH